MGALRGMTLKVCALVSGGFDSSVLVAELLDRGVEVTPFYVSSGFYWERAELHWLRRFLHASRGPLLRPLVIADAPMRWAMGEHWSLTGRGVPSSRAAWDSVYLPGRNLLLLSQAGVYAATHKLGRVMIGTLKGNPFADSTPRFFRDMESAINDALRSDVRVEAPYARCTKAQVARRAAALRRRFPVELTFSCLRPRGIKPCGSCSKCGERRHGLPQAQRAPKTSAMRE